MQINELKDLRDRVDSLINESERQEAARRKKTIDTYKTNLNLLESVSKIMESCSYSDSGVVDFAKQYYDALTDPAGPREERIYETFIEGLDQYAYLNPVQDEIYALKDRVKGDKRNIDLVELLDIMKESSSFYIVEHIEDAVIAYMDNNNASTRVQLLSAINPYLYDPFVKQIYAMVNNNLSKEQILVESYKMDKTLESLENTGDLIGEDVVTPVIALDSTRTAIKLGPKWLTLSGRTFAEVKASTDIPDDDRRLGNILDDTETVYVYKTHNEIWYSLEHNIQTDRSPVLITDTDNIVYNGDAYTADEFALINNALQEPLQLVDINNICLIASRFDDIAYLDNTILYKKGDGTDNIQVYVTVFDNGVDDSGDTYSVVIIDKAASSYEIYNDMREEDLVRIMNDTLDTGIVALTESSKGDLETKKKDFKKKCRAFESQIRDLKSKKAKLEEIYKKFESDEVGDSIDSITKDIEDVERDYSDFQKEHDKLDPHSSGDIYGPDDDDNVNIKDISFQKDVDVKDIEKPLYSDEPLGGEEPTGEEIDTLDTNPDEEDVMALDSTGEYDDVEDYMDSEEEDTEESDNTVVYFNSKLDKDADRGSYLSGKVHTDYAVINPETGEQTVEIVTANFYVKGNTGTPERDIELYSVNETIPTEVYNRIINNIADSEEYKGFVDVDNAMSSIANEKDIVHSPVADDYLSDVMMEGPIKSLTIEGVCEGKKYVKSVSLNEAMSKKIGTVINEADAEDRDAGDVDPNYDFDAIDTGEPVGETLEAEDNSLETIINGYIEDEGRVYIEDDGAGTTDDLVEDGFMDMEYVNMLDSDSPENETTVFRINFDGPVDNAEESVYNKVYGIIGAQDEARDFLEDIAAGDFDEKEISDMIIEEYSREAGDDFDGIYLFEVKDKEGMAEYLDIMDEYMYGSADEEPETATEEDGDTLTSYVQELASYDDNIIVDERESGTGKDLVDANEVVEDVEFQNITVDAYTMTLFKFDKLSDKVYGIFGSDTDANLLLSDIVTGNYSIDELKSMIVDDYPAEQGSTYIYEVKDVDTFKTYIDIMLEDVYSEDLNEAVKLKLKKRADDKEEEEAAVDDLTTDDIDTAIIGGDDEKEEDEEDDSKDDDNSEDDSDEDGDSDEEDKESEKSEK